MKTDTRDRLKALAAAEMPGASPDAVIIYLLDQRWQAVCVEQADRWREQHPEQWREDLLRVEAMSRNLTSLDTP